MQEAANRLADAVSTLTRRWSKGHEAPQVGRWCPVPGSLAAGGTILRLARPRATEPRRPWEKQAPVHNLTPAPGVSMRRQTVG